MDSLLLALSLLVFLVVIAFVFTAKKRHPKEQNQTYHDKPLDHKIPQNALRGDSSISRYADVREGGQRLDQSGYVLDNKIEVDSTKAGSKPKGIDAASSGPSIYETSKLQGTGQRLSQSGKALKTLDDIAWHKLPSEFVIFDLETTGLPYRDPVDIVEISAIRVNKQNYLTSNRVDTFTTLVKPWRGGLDPRATAVNQITQEMIDKEGVDISIAIKQFLEFVGNNSLVAYNAKFDRWFLDRELHDQGIFIRFKYECAYNLAKNAFPNMGNYKLTTVASSLGVPTAGAHRALQDCVMAMHVYIWGITAIENRKPSQSYKIDRHNIKHDEDLENLSVIFIGTLPTFTHEEAAILAKQAGMKIEEVNVDKVDIVVAGKNAGKKLQQAQALNKEIYSEERFLVMINSVIAKPRDKALSY